MAVFVHDLFADLVIGRRLGCLETGVDALPMEGLLRDGYRIHECVSAYPPLAKALASNSSVGVLKWGLNIIGAEMIGIAGIKK